MTHMFTSANALSNANKGLIHFTFSPNSNWPYDWSAFVPNYAPAITSYDGNATVAHNTPENQAFAVDVNATDANGDTLTYSKSGADASKFTINVATGALGFSSAPDFENPTDAGANNTYVVEVNASDGASWDLQTITVTVTNVNEAPTAIALGGALSSLTEDVDTSSATKVGDVVITDPDGGNAIGQGPVHHWKLNEAVGANTATDAGTGNTPLSLQGGAMFLGSGAGGGVSLPSAQSSSLDFGDNFAFAATEGFSFATWIRFGSLQYWARILEIEDSSQSNWLRVANTGVSGIIGRPQANFLVKNNGSATNFYTPLNDANVENFFPSSVGQWMHIVATVSPGGEMRLYRDGATRNEWKHAGGVAPNPNSVTYTKAALGCRDAAGARYFDGDLRDVRIYNYALTDGQVEDLFQYGGDTNTVTLSGADAASFEVVGDELFLKSGIALDYATKNSYAVTLTTGDESVAHTLAVADVNYAPVITSYGGAATVALNAPENQTFAADVNVSDADADALTYSITGGADASKFTINAATGALGFSSAPDFENPTDADANNTYVVEVNASDGAARDLQTITVTVTDANDAPTGTVTITGTMTIVDESPSREASFVHKVTPEDGGADRFGDSVSQSGDLMAVGASRADVDGQRDAGAAYVYRVESNGSISLLQKVHAPDAVAHNYFGHSVSISGDILAVGAYKANVSGKKDAGAVYLFRVEGDGAVSFIDKVVAEDNEASAIFGWSVSQSGGVLAVGSRKVGAVYLYRVGIDGAVSFIDKVVAEDGSTGDQFGYSVSQSGDILAIGASKWDVDGEQDAGAVYLYRMGSDGAVSFIDKVVAEDGKAFDNFGYSVSQSDNLLAVGALRADAAYLYRVGSMKASFITKIVDSEEVNDNQFGTSVSLSGDVLAVGAHGTEVAGNSYAGTVHLYKVETNGTATRLDGVIAPDGEVYDFFGMSVSHSDGILAVGANGVNKPEMNFNEAGAAYVFDIGHLVVKRAPVVRTIGSQVATQGQVLTAENTLADADGLGANDGSLGFSVVTWGDSDYGGNSTSVGTHLASGVVEVSSNERAFAALKADGSVVTWGNSYYIDKMYSDDETEREAAMKTLATQLENGVVEVFSNSQAFAALKEDGSVVTWGRNWAGGDSSSVAAQLAGGIVEVFSNGEAFAALKEDGSVVTWGSSGGGDSSSVAAQLAGGVVKVFSHRYALAFAALKEDGSVVTWGQSNQGGSSSSVAAQLAGGIVEVSSNGFAFAALKADGSVVTWGNSEFGGDSSSVAAQLAGGVVKVFSNRYALAALKEDGSVVTWGRNYAGGNSSSAAAQLAGGVLEVFSNERGLTFAALKEDGSVVTWGFPGQGGDSSSVAAQLAGGVAEVFSSRYAFAALKEDGSVVTWGHSNYGGDSSTVAAQLAGGVVEVFSSERAFAALKVDGSVVSWGNAGYGGNNSSVAAQLAGGVVKVFSNQRAFVALKGDQPLVTITMAYQWNRDGNPIAGETNSTYTLTQADVGKAITVTAGYTDGAGNPESVTSAVTTVDSEPALPAAWWASAEEATAGWRISSWFGAFRPYENGWIFHADLGWLYVQSDGVDGLWVWSKGKGWLWTNPGSYRYLYQSSSSEWIYFLKRKNGQAYFYNYATGLVD